MRGKPVICFVINVICKRIQYIGINMMDTYPVEAFAKNSRILAAQTGWKGYNEINCKRSDVR